MPGPPSPEHRPVVSLADERERVIQRLSEHFANDRLSMEELEQRIEAVYKATTAAELQRLTADLPGDDSATMAAPIRLGDLPVLTPDRDRVVAIMSETRRRGAWIVPQRLDIVSVMSDTTIDLTQAPLPTGIIDIHVRSLFATVKIVVPPGLQVVSRVNSLMSSVHGGGEPTESAEAGSWRQGTVVRLSGWALMAEVQTKVRRREQIPGEALPTEHDEQ